ncbi:MAG: ABC transporter permease [Chloroflexi bacterium]|nr:ABC transporter permease [Chloroflexota bacterium]
MRNYIIRRTLINIPVILLVATMVFFATNVLPGDFVAQRIAANNPTPTSSPEEVEAQIQKIREDLGIDDPIAIRYVKYLGDLVRGDFGTSYQSGRSAIRDFREGIPYTLQLSLMAFTIALLTSIPIGIISAIRQDSPIDYFLRFFAILAVAAPNFWVATMLLLYVVRWKLWDIQLTEHPLLWEDPIGSLKLFVIPAVAGGLAGGAGIMRLLRSQMLEVLRQDYIRTAWAKGVRERVIIVRHALKNALIPVLTVIGLTIAGLLSGNVVFEYLFGIPGVGNRILTAINKRDVPVVQAFVVIIATFVVFVNLAIDLLYGIIDPRIRFS